MNGEATEEVPCNLIIIRRVVWDSQGLGLTQISDTALIPRLPFKIWSGLNRKQSTVKFSWSSKERVVQSWFIFGSIKKWRLLELTGRHFHFVFTVILNTLQWIERKVSGSINLFRWKSWNWHEIVKSAQWERAAAFHNLGLLDRAT